MKKIIPVLIFFTTTLLYGQPGTLPGFRTSLSCNRNAVCEPDWCNQRRSTVLMTNGGTVIGSGVLVNNTKNDFTPYVLTSFRLIDSDNDGVISESEKNNLLHSYFVFNYFSPDCGTTNIPLHGINDYVIGATFITGEKCNNADKRGYALLRLNQPIPSEFGAYYSGWNLQTVVSGAPPNKRPAASYGGAGIHYPHGDVKKISFYDNNNLGYGKVYEVNTDDCPHWTAKWNKNGTGFPMKSNVEFEFPTGSPLFNGNKQLIGIHFENVDYDSDKMCKNKPPSSYYEALHIIWQKSTPYGTLKQYLDPTSTNVTNYPGAERCINDHLFMGRTTLHTDQYAGLYTAFRDITAGSGTIIQPYTEVTFQAGTKIELLPGFIAESNSHFTAEIKICSNYCGGGIGRLNTSDSLLTSNFYQQELDMSAEEIFNITDNPNEIAEKDTLIFYPNPAQDKVNIFCYCTKSSNFIIHIKNTSGETVKTILHETTLEYGEHLFEVSITDLPNGVYYAIVQNDRRQYKYSKIVILK